ncbi:13343_t:CDS:2, partial [Funneliformis mosseae]
VIEQGIYCDIQGILINLGDVSSGFWAIVSLSNLLLTTDNGKRFYGNADDSWCWIDKNKDFQEYRNWFSLWYCCGHEHHLRHHKGFTESELNMKACLVPVVYIILVFPLAL